MLCCLPSLNLFQSLITDAEVVSDFVLEHPFYLDIDSVGVTAFCLEGLLKDGYLVRKYHPVAAGAFGLGHSLIKPKQRVAML